MHIDAPHAWNIQHRLRQDESIRCDDHQVRFEFRYVVDNLLIPQGCRLPDRNVLLERIHLDGTGRDFLATPCRPVGLRQHRDRRITGIDQCRKRRPGKVGRAGKDNFCSAHR